MEPIFSKPLTEAQKQEIKLLHRKFSLKNGLTGAKFGLFIVGANYAVVMLNFLWVHSDYFPFIGAAISAILFLGQMQKELNARGVEFLEELKKIVNKE